MDDPFARCSRAMESAEELVRSIRSRLADGRAPDLGDLRNLVTEAVEAHRSGRLYATEAHEPCGDPTQETGTIYELADPRDGRRRYVGATIRPLKQRLNGHWSDRHCTSQGVVAWMQELDQLGLRPRISPIHEHVPVADMADMEAAERERSIMEGIEIVNRPGPTQPYFTPEGLQANREAHSRSAARVRQRRSAKAE